MINHRCPLPGGIAAATAGAIFYGNGLFGTIMFIWLSPRWVILQNDWKAMERFIDRFNLKYYLTVNLFLF